MVAIRMVKSIVMTMAMEEIVMEIMAVMAIMVIMTGIIEQAVSIHACNASESTLGGRLKTIGDARDRMEIRPVPGMQGPCAGSPRKRRNPMLPTARDPVMAQVERPKHTERRPIIDRGDAVIREKAVFLGAQVLHEAIASVASQPENGGTKKKPKANLSWPWA